MPTYSGTTQGRPELATIAPISTAPCEPGHTLLLYCPEQGGWQVGEWLEDDWHSTTDGMELLQPTHWTEVPPAPN